MKVLIVTGKLYKNLYEGTQKSVVNLANRMSEEGHEINWLTREKYKGKNFRKQGPPNELADNISVYYTKMSKSNIKDIRRQINKINPDIINVHTSSGRMGLFWTLNFPKKTLVTFPCWTKWGTLEKLSFNFIRKTAVTKAVDNKLPGKNRITRYPVDTESYDSQKAIDTSKPTLFYIGEPSEFRGFDQACKALSHLDIDFEFKVAVAEGLGDKETAERKLKEHGIRKNTELTIGFVENLPEYINEGDICLNLLENCRRTTSPPIFGLEAMSCGRVPLYSDVPEFREVIDDGENGFLVDDKDYEEIARRIEWLSQNPEKAVEIGKKARNKIIEKHSIESSVKSFEKIYKKITS